MRVENAIRGYTIQCLITQKIMPTYHMNNSIFRKWKQSFQKKKYVFYSI